MNTKGNTKVLLSWSYSVYTQWLKCPFSVYLDKIARVRVAEEPSNPHMEKGSRVHDNAEAAIKAPRKIKLDKDLAKHDKVVQRVEEFRKGNASVEGELAFDRNWTRVDWRDWTKAWLRVKCDAILTKLKPKPVVHIVDWKTGKLYDDHKQQRSLYALAGLQLVKLGELANGNPKTEVIAEHLYTDTGMSATETFKPEQLEPLKKEWLERIKFMMKDTKFTMKEGPQCRWCRHRKSAGGSCPADQ